MTETMATQSAIENIFINSNSSDELFDAFGSAIKAGIRSSTLYKSLIRNKTLSNDEILMYTEKVCKDFPEMRYDIYLSTAQMLFSKSLPGEDHLTAFKYFQKASEAEKEKLEPYLAVIKMYNKELNIPRLSEVSLFVKEGIKNTTRKSTLCFELAKLFKARGDITGFRELQSAGEIFQREGN